MTDNEPKPVEPIAVEIVRTRTDVEIFSNAIVVLIFTTPVCALIVWWLLHYLPVPDLNYWQTLAFVVIVRLLGSMFGRTTPAWTRERK